jgi:hypothetical protein
MKSWKPWCLLYACIAYIQKPLAWVEGLFHGPSCHRLFPESYLKIASNLGKP